MEGARAAVPFLAEMQLGFGWLKLAMRNPAGLRAGDGLGFESMIEPPN